MFKCVSCGGNAIKRAFFVEGGHSVVCAICNVVHEIRESAGELSTDTLVLEPEPLVLEEPMREEEVVKFPWLYTAPEEQMEEMRRELEIPPDVEIPEPGPDVATEFPSRELEPGVPVYEHDQEFYRPNMNRLWSYGWEWVGNLLGDDLYTEFAYPILTQFANTPEYVEKLYTPYGGSNLQLSFLGAVKENMYKYFEERGLDVIIGGGKAGELDFDLRPKNPELADYVYQIVFRTEHPDFLGPMPKTKMDPNAPILHPRSLELPYMAELMKKIQVWEEVNV